MEWLTKDPSCIARICLRRSLPCKAHFGSLNRVELILASEFYDPVPGLLAKSSIYCSVHKASSKTQIGEEELLCAKSQKDDIGVYVIKTPQKEGEYYITLRCILNEDEHSNMIVLSWVSDLFTVADEEVSDGSDAFGITQKMLSCYRQFTVNSEAEVLRFREDYGAGMGSHIYDSAVVLMRYMWEEREIEEASDLKHEIALELGSGCGLFGVFLAYIFEYKSVILTDKGSQLSLLKRNVAENAHITKKCGVFRLDWASTEDLMELKAPLLQSGATSMTLFGADVLYENEAATHLVLLLTKLVDFSRCSSSGKLIPTVMILAQRMRGEEAVEVLEQFAAFNPKLVKEECRVKVWKLTLT